jgi:hypothetical protein
MHRSAGKAAKSSNQRHLASQPDALGLATRLANGRLREAGSPAMLRHRALGEVACPAQP